MKRTKKVALVEHLGVWHGKQRLVTPPRELLRWRREELEQTHKQMHDEEQ